MGRTRFKEERRESITEIALRRREIALYKIAGLILVPKAAVRAAVDTCLNAVALAVVVSANPITGLGRASFAVDD